MIPDHLIGSMVALSPAEAIATIRRRLDDGGEAGDLATSAVRALLAAYDDALAALEYERGTIAYHVAAAEEWLRGLHRLADALGARARRSDPLPEVDDLVACVVALRAQADAPRVADEAAERTARGQAWALSELTAERDVLRGRLAAAEGDAVRVRGEVAQGMATGGEGR